MRSRSRASLLASLTLTACYAGPPGGGASTTGLSGTSGGSTAASSATPDDTASPDPSGTATEATGATETDTDDPGPAAVVMPLEVLGAAGYEDSRVLMVDDPAGIDGLYLRTHRLAYLDVSTNPERGAKGSVRLNDGPWVPLDATSTLVHCFEHEQKWGCLDGAYHSVRFSVELGPLGAVRAGANELAFRLEGTDGTSSGYRVLEMDLLRGEQRVLGADAFVEDDPDRWSPPRPAAEDIEQGRQLWAARDWLEASPLDPDSILRASCADCHAADGRDLQYFNYSNWSIVARSEFHGLTRTQGEQIASYIRSLDLGLPAGITVGALGRPWNPPYQPGPGLDDRPAVQWAAGAGLDAVLEQDADMLPYLFPDGTSPEAIAAVVSTRGTLNARQMPIALQLPDWNAWLTDEHPAEDALWGEDFFQTPPALAYAQTLASLEGGGAEMMRTDPAAIAERRLIEQTLDPLRQRAGQFVSSGGPQPCRNSAVHGSEGFAQLGRPAEVPTQDQWDDPDVCERPLRALGHWNAVKHWEVMQRFGLEDAVADVYPYGEARGWPGGYRQVFDLAPHRIGNDSFTFAHLGRKQGSYLNTAWYQLNVIINAGNRNPLNHRPPDWKYQMDHMFIASDEHQDPIPLRYVQTLIKMQQNLDMRAPAGAPTPPEYAPYLEDRGPTSNGWWLTHVTPWRLVSIGGSFFNHIDERFAVWDQLDDIEPGLRLKVQNALLEAWLDKTETYDIDQWPRGDGQNNVNPADYVPTPYPGEGRISDSGTHADGVYRTIPYMREAGIDEALIERLRAWGQAMWPAGDWDALRAD